MFSWVLPLLIVTQCPKVSSDAISWKNNEPNLKKWQKTLCNKKRFRPDFGLFGPNLGPNLFIYLFFLILLLLDVRLYCKLSLYAIVKKANEPN